MQQKDILSSATLQKVYDSFFKKQGQTNIYLIQDLWVKAELLKQDQVELVMDVTAFETALNEPTQKPILVSCYLINELLLDKLLSRSDSQRPIFYNLCKDEI